MTSPNSSPSKFQGLPWETWTNSLGRTAPIEDKPPEPKPVEKNKGCVMKLPKSDMKTFGLCPEKDLFTVVKCETCGISVKPQALLHHFENRHLNNDVQPSQPPVEMAVIEKSSTKVVKMVKNPQKVKTKKTPSKESSKGREGGMNPPPRLPVSLTLESSIAEPGTSKGETLQPVVALTPLSGGPAAPAHNKTSTSTSATAPPMLNKARRPPRKHAPIKEREYDPDKHCGVITAENMKPCTWSLTCKSHPMSLRRAVTGRSKPFDQLLADHRSAKEALLKQKKNLELQNAAAVPLNPPASQPSINMEPKIGVMEKHSVAPVDITPLLLRLPELNLDVTPSKQMYLSAAPPSLVVKSGDKPAPAPAATPAPSTMPPPAQSSTPTQTDVIAYTLNHPRALGVSSMFSTHKIGGLVYTNRRMQIARQGLESCLHRAGNGIYLSSHGLPMPSTLSNVLNNVSSRAAQQKNKAMKRNKSDKANKPNKKMCLGKDPNSVGSMQLNNSKSVLTRQYPPNTQNRMSASSTTDMQFHMPNILSNALKRPDTITAKTQNKKLKKKTSPIMNSVLSNHSKNGLTPNYVRVAIANSKVEPEPKTHGLCETPKFSNSNKILNETDLRKMGLRFEIFE